MSSNTQMRISRHGPKSFLTAMLPLIVALSLICVFLPRDIADDYTLRLMQLSLFIGFICALRAAQTHLRELRNVFLFIALFILFVLLSNTVTFWDALVAVFGWSPYLSLIIAGIAYTMLIISCIYVIKIIHVQKLLMYEWAIIGIMSIVSVIILSLIHI